MRSSGGRGGGPRVEIGIGGRDSLQMGCLHFEPVRDLPDRVPDASLPCRGRFSFRGGVGGSRSIPLVRRARSQRVGRGAALVLAMCSRLVSRVEGVKIFTMLSACRNKLHKLWASAKSAISRAARAASTVAQTTSLGTGGIVKYARARKTSQRALNRAILTCRAAIATDLAQKIGCNSCRLASLED